MMPRLWNFLERIGVLTHPPATGNERGGKLNSSHSSLHLGSAQVTLCDVMFHSSEMGFLCRAMHTLFH